MSQILVLTIIYVPTVVPWISYIFKNANMSLVQTPEVAIINYTGNTALH